MSKTWLVGLLMYAVYAIKQFTGFEVPEQAVDMIADIILLIIPLIAIFKNRKKHYDDGPAV